MIDPEIAKYGATGIALATLVILGWVIRYSLTSIVKSMEANTEATRALKDTTVKTSNKLVKAIDSAAGINKETYDFLKTLNGDLRAVIQKKRSTDDNSGLHKRA